MTAPDPSPFLGRIGTGSGKSVHNLRAAVLGSLLDFRGDAPSPPPPCPGCGGVMGDGDRVHHGRCSGCHLGFTRPAARCWCGRRISTLPEATGIWCAEHDTGPHTGPVVSDPTTPGGVFGDRTRTDR